MVDALKFMRDGSGDHNYYQGDVADLSPGGLDEGPSAAVGLPPGVVFLSGSCICAGSVIMGIERVKKKES